MERIPPSPETTLNALGSSFHPAPPSLAASSRGSSRSVGPGSPALLRSSASARRRPSQGAIFGDSNEREVSPTSRRSAVGCGAGERRGSGGGAKLRRLGPGSAAFDGASKNDRRGAISSPRGRHTPLRSGWESSAPTTPRRAPRGGRGSSSISATMIWIGPCGRLGNAGPRLWPERWGRRNLWRAQYDLDRSRDRVVSRRPAGDDAGSARAVNTRALHRRETTAPELPCARPPTLQEQLHRQLSSGRYSPARGVDLPFSPKASRRFRAEKPLDHRRAPALSSPEKAARLPPAAGLERPMDSRQPMQTPTFTAVPTVVGSFPHTKPTRWSSQSSAASPSCRPGRSCRRATCAKACTCSTPRDCRARSSTARRSGSSSAWTTSLRSALESFYQAVVEEDVERFAIGRDYALGLHLFLEAVRGLRQTGARRGSRGR